ncbi:MAG: rhodanese-like domain-containing protein [Acidimicrobiales bacterium]
MPESHPASPDVPEIEPSEAVQLVGAGAVILDVRETDEFSQGRAKGAFHIPFSSLADRLAEIPVDRPVIVVCRSGGRSYWAAKSLATRGYVSMNLAGGMHAWHDEGLPVVRDDGSPGVVA